MFLTWWLISIRFEPPLVMWWKRRLCDVPCYFDELSQFRYCMQKKRKSITYYLRSLCDILSIFRWLLLHCIYNFLDVVSEFYNYFVSFVEACLWYTIYPSLVYKLCNCVEVSRSILCIWLLSSPNGRYF